MTQSISGSPFSLRHGRHHLAIPGPSVMPDRVLSAMARPMPNIYSGELVDVSDDVMARLPAIVRTEGEPFVIIANGHGAWQMVINNTMSRGDKVLVLESGSFATNWGSAAAISGVEVEVLPGTDRDPVDPAAVADRLKADIDHEIRAILVVQSDTSTSVKNDISALRAAIDEADHPALFLVDCVASVGCDRFEMDAWGVDVTVGASQKGLMTPPGLGMVWANDKALKAAERADLVDAYNDWRPRTNPDVHYQIYAGTPPTSHLFALQVALDMIDEQGGMEAVWHRHEVLAKAVWAAVDAWSTPDGIEHNIVDPAHRSTAVTTIRTNSIDADALRELCEVETGMTLGLGIGPMKGRAFRIGHMGHLNPPMILGTLGTVEAGLAAMDAPIGGSGVAAAADVIGQAIARKQI